MTINFAKYDRLDDVALYEYDTEAVEVMYNAFGDYKHERGWDMSKMPDGSMRPYFSGGDMPWPEKPLDSVSAAKLEKEFLLSYKQTG